MQQPPSGVVVPPELCRVLARIASRGLDEITKRNGGPPIVPGLAAVLARLDGVSARATLAGTVEPARVTVAEAAVIAGISRQRVRQLAASGRLIASKRGRDWHVDRSSAEDYRKARDRN